jgi:hypothetical protein
MSTTVVIRLLMLIIVVTIPMDSEGANDVKQLAAGVVKISARPEEGSTKIGTGFIVRIEPDLAYIVTAAHVVAGDMHPQVEMFTKRNVFVPAEVLGVEGGDEVRGLALLVVRGRVNLPQGIAAIPLAPTTRVSGGEEVLIIGFPRGAGPWAVIRGSIVARRGRDIDLAAALDEGNSGGPIIQHNKAIGLVAGVSRSYGHGVPAMSIQDYLEGFGITVGSPDATPRPERPSIKPTVKKEKSGPNGKGEIIGKDGAPMVLVPSGEFLMGNENGQADDERPAHYVSVERFYIDKFEVTVDQYREFLRATGQETAQDQR